MLHRVVAERRQYQHAAVISKEVSSHCSPEVEFLMISCRPHYLLREFSSIIFVAVLHTTTVRGWHQDSIKWAVFCHKQTRKCSKRAALLVAGDFNAGKLKSILPHFYQHVKCATRGEKTLDHLYSTHREPKLILTLHLAKLTIILSSWFLLISKNSSRMHQWLDQ